MDQRLTRDEYDEDSCCDEHPGPWLGIGFAVLAAFAAWVAWLFLAGCIYIDRPTFNVLPIQPGRTDTPTVRRTQPAASAPASSRPWTVEELQQRLQESE